MANRDHLKAFQWKPGQSGNPKGRPKTPSFETIVRAVVAEMVEATQDDGQKVEVTKKEVLARKFVDLMRGGNVRVFLAYLAREWPEVHLIGGDPDHPLALSDVVRSAGSDPGGKEKTRTPRRKKRATKKTKKKAKAKRGTP